MEYPEGSRVTLRATATQNYTFLRWSDGSTLNPRNLTMDRDYVLEDGRGKPAEFLCPD